MSNIRRGPGRGMKLHRRYPHVKESVAVHQEGAHRDLAAHRRVGQSGLRRLVWVVAFAVGVIIAAVVVVAVSALTV